jgi:hypothetical protein
MPDRERTDLQLRAIRVSAHAALASHRGDGVDDWIRSRTMELLAALEAAVLRDGGDEDILAAIEVARREFEAP